MDGTPIYRVPTELLSLICSDSDLSRGTLAILSRTWCSFLAVCQRILYHTVDLSGASPRDLRSWCLAISRHKHLADRVHSLTLSLEPTVDIPPRDAVKLSTAVHGCPNLKVLHVRRASGTDHSFNGDWLLGDACPFQLDALTNGYFNFFALRPFLATQNQLRLLAHEGGVALVASETRNALQAEPMGSGHDDPRPQLPALIGVKMELRNLHAASSWPIQRVEASYGGTLFGIARFEKTLTTLNLLKDYHDAGLLLKRMKEIANILPMLVNLALVDMPSGTPRHLPWIIAVQSPVSLVKNFKRLETLTIVARNVDRFGTAPDKTYHSLEDSEMRAMALATLDALPTIRRVVIGTERLPGVERMHIAARGAETITENEVDFDAVSMFWV
ncbi:hypothetical protein MKEN_01449400 [Mycena kentingensis (nom. inval.)]|nr:hypothetical protein MKEN_01449400 [Mycena kentingensis (nom. inval.)]